MIKLNKLLFGKLLGFMKKNIWLWLAALVLAVIVGIGAQYVLKVKDHPIEQLCEDAIKDMTGFDIDFSK